MSVFNIIGPKFDETANDYKLFNDDDVLIPLTETDKSMAHLLVRLNCFKSVGDAKRNGWGKPVPLGWSEFKVGKKFIFIWNPEHTLKEFERINPDD